MRISTAPRPYVLAYPTSSYRITSVEAQSLIDEFTANVTRATAQRVVIAYDGTTAVLRPATLGGGPAFVIER